MGRNKTTVRKRGGHTEDAMRKAMELVKSGMSIRKASVECQLKYPTVRLYVNKIKANPEVRLTPNYEVNKIFTSEQEKELSDYIEYCAQLFYGLTTKDCRRVAYQMAKANNIKIPRSWIDSEMAGFEWLRSFRKRHPEISLRKPEACSLARATAFNKHNIESFFGNLKSVMERHPSFADGTRVYNLDETSTTTVQRPGKILARKGTNTTKVTSGERGTLVTTCCIVSATGQALPPAMVFPRKKFQPHMIHGAPPGTLGLAAASGWMNAEIFVDVIKHFTKHVSASKENPALLIMDNHESHLSIEALDLAKSSGVTVLTLHPHTTAKLQPLDVGLNGPFKSYYNAAVDSWLMRHPGQPLTIYNIAECVGSAYMKSMTPINIVNAFKKTGIFPFDDCIFTEVDFMPSTVTDRPQVVQEIDDQREKCSTSPSLLENVGSTSQDNDIRPAIIEVPDLIASLSAPEDVDLQLDLPRNYDNDTTPPMMKAPDLPASTNRNTGIPSPVIEDPDLSAPSRVLKEVGNQNITPRLIETAGPSKFISPKEFMPPIKAKPRDPKKRRAPGKSMIATDTPEKDAIAAKKIKVIKKQIKKAKKDLFTDDQTQKKNKKAINERKKNIESDYSSDEKDFVASGSSSGGEEYYISENEDEDEEGRIILDGNFLPLQRDPKDKEYVIILFPFKKTSVYYVAKILETTDDEDDFDFFVSFFRLKSRVCQTFCEPLEPDTAGVQVKDIKYILPNPKIIGSSRRQAAYLFDVYFDLTQLNLR